MNMNMDTEVATETSMEPAEATDLTAPKQRKPRKTKIENAKSTLDAALAKLDTLTLKLSALISMTGYSKTSDKRRDDVELASTRVETQKRVIASLTEKLEKVTEATEQKKLIAEERERSAALVAEVKKGLSDGAYKAIVDLKTDQDKRFDGKKEKNDNIWPEVHAGYLQKIKNGDLPASDHISLEAMRAKYDKELSHFRWYAKEVQRYKVSGAPADDVDRIPTRCTPPACTHSHHATAHFYSACAPQGDD